MFHCNYNSGFKQQINKNMFEDMFLKNLLSFMNDSDDSSTSSGYASETFSVNNVVTSGNFNSFSGKMYGDLTYRRCNFSNMLYASWTKSSAGLIASTRESKSTAVKSIPTRKADHSIDLDRSFPACVTNAATTVKDKALFFRKYLRNSLLPEFENHPVRLRRIAEGIESIDLQPRSITKRTLPAQDVLSRPCDSPKNGKLHVPAETNPWKICRFCLKNGEPEVVFRGHLVKGLDGTVTCPILRRYVCDLCGATGSQSHTRKYCPLYKEAFAQPEYRKLANGILALGLGHK